MRLTLFGTRGSVPAPGPETARYGGNTARLCAVIVLVVFGVGYWLLLHRLNYGRQLLALGDNLYQQTTSSGEATDGNPGEDCVEVIAATHNFNDERCNTSLPAICVATRSASSSPFGAGTRAITASKPSGISCRSHVQVTGS